MYIFESINSIIGPEFMNNEYVKDFLKTFQEILTTGGSFTAAKMLSNSIYEKMLNNEKDSQESDGTLSLILKIIFKVIASPAIGMSSIIEEFSGISDTEGPLTVFLIIFLLSSMYSRYMPNDGI